MADQPYTEADVERVAEALKASNVKRWETGKPVPAWCDLATAALDALVAAGRLLPEGARANGMCGRRAPTLFGANLDLQVCELTAGHKGWHGRPNGPGEPRMNWTEDMIVSGSTDE
jgi:hypothetical protein